MAKLYGTLGRNDTDRLFQDTDGARVVYKATQQILDSYNMTLNASLGLLVEETTELFKERFKLPNIAYMQRRGLNSPVGVIRGDDGWDVAYPLEDFGDAIGANDVELAYLTVGDFDRHVQNVLINDTMTVRFELLKSIFNSTAATFVDGRNGSLTIQRLANGDSTVYPPIIGATATATENHYYGTNYTTANISDTNNPIATIVDELEEHFGTPTGGSRIAVFINPAETAKIKALTDFVDVNDSFITPGDSTAVTSYPPELANGSWRVLGRSNGAWVVEWRFIPATYLLGIHLDAEKPVKMRVDLANTGLGTGLQLVADEMEFPMEQWTWRHRFGFGVGNRLNGVVLQTVASTSYTVPTIYQ